MLHSSAVDLADPPTATLVVDSEHSTLVRNPFSLQTSECVCRFRVYAVGEGIVVVITEKDGSCKLTDTYAIEQIASEILPAVVKPSDRRDTISWVAHIPLLTDFSSRQGRFFQVTFERFLGEKSYRTEKTRYGVFSRGAWKRISREQLEQLIGMGWE